MHVSAVILNYNNWRDTIDCVESLLASNAAPYRIFVVDNASANNSVDHMYNHFIGNKDIACARLDEHGNDGDISGYDLVFCELHTNKGYAAGNNFGIAMALKDPIDAVWILNNDVVVVPGALDALVKRVENFSGDRPVGLCGACVCYMHDKSVQCCGGGRTNRMTGLSVLYGAGLSLEEAGRLKAEEVERGCNFIYGAAVLATRAFIEEVGLMDEGYFLYCEEQDWALRNRGRFALAYAPGAVVYHKEGGSTGWSGRKATLQGMWRITRSRLRLAWRHTPHAIPTVLAAIVFAALRMLYRRV